MELAYMVAWRNGAPITGDGNGIRRNGQHGCGQGMQRTVPQAGRIEGAGIVGMCASQVYYAMKGMV
jgi:hypothetical protein